MAKVPGRCTIVSLRSLKKGGTPRPVFDHTNYLTWTELESTTTDKGRWYWAPTGEKLISVTTFLGKTSDKTPLLEWEQRLGKENADKERDRCSERGEGIHLAAEYYLRNMPMNEVLAVVGDYENMFWKLKRFLDLCDDMYALEIPLYSTNMELAGRVDCVARYRGILSIIDFKTSTKLKNKSFIENYFLQATIYSIMIEQMFGIKISQLVVAIAVENDPKPQIFVEQRSNFIPILLQRIKQFRAM